MALMLTRDNVLARFGGYRGGAHSLVHGASSMIKGELSPLMRSVTTSASAMAFGVLQGKWYKEGGLAIGPLPVDLTAGVVFHTLSLFNFTRDYTSLMHAIGDGALATYFATSGFKVGQRWRDGGTMLPKIKDITGAFVGEDKPVSGGSSVTDDELKNLVRG